MNIYLNNENLISELAELGAKLKAQEEEFEENNSVVCRATEERETLDREFDRLKQMVLDMYGEREYAPLTLRSFDVPEPITPIEEEPLEAKLGALKAKLSALDANAGQGQISAQDISAAAHAEEQAEEGDISEELERLRAIISDMQK